LRRAKVEAMLSGQSTDVDFKEATETVALVLAETFIEAATDYEPQYDDTEAIWDVSIWE
jgi:hypothetical protein